MKRRSRAGSKPAKARRHRAVKPKGRSAPKAMPRRGSAPAGRDTEVARLTRERDEALGQQAATADVLQIISSSPGNLDTVLETILANATRLCEANFGVLLLYESAQFRVAAAHNPPPAFAELRRRQPEIRSSGVLARFAVTKQLLHIADCTEDPSYKRGDGDFVAFVDLCGVRTLLGAPLLKKGELIGMIGLYRQEVRRFTGQQVELVRNFAAQAVIAIENARLLRELRESLQEQTATSEVLQVISTSPGDLEPVFAAMLEKAVRICDAKFGGAYRWDGEVSHLITTHNVPPAFAEFRRRSQPSLDARMVAAKTTVHVIDLKEDAGYIGRDPSFVAAVELGGARTVLVVPMLRENELIGSFHMARGEVRPFTDKQIAVVTNFATQAVIAIENARLLNELRQRTADLSQRTVDLTESLEQQTATAEVLQVISSSPGDLQPVFEAMLENAVRICDATFGNIYRWDGNALHLVSSHNTPPAYAEYRKRVPMQFDQMPESMRQMIETRLPGQTDPLAALDHEPNNTIARAGVEIGGIRTVLNVPMVKENELVGALILSRREVSPFNDKQLALVMNFARQAAIAIENARLLKELRERTSQLEVQSQKVVKLNQQLEQRVADQVGEIERMGRLRRFLPPQVADLIVASGTEKQLESHRQEITALFCDLRGFTGFSESADPEDVMALLGEYHAAIGEIIIKYSGTLERYAGDGVMVVFNDPVPVPKPALQAVHAALDMRAAIGTLTERWSRLGHDLGFGVGIAHGHATLGTIGFEGRFDYAAIGTVSNVASRLCDEAKPGQILISPRVLMAVEDAVTVEPIGEFALKGIRRPIAAYNVVAALPPSP